MFFDRETCLQYDGKIIKIKFHKWTWNNGTNTPEGFEVLLKVDLISREEIQGILIASDKLPFTLFSKGRDSFVAIRYHIIHSIEIVNNSDVALFVGYPNTYSFLEKMLKEA
jgi:hypothetical protein